MSEPGQAVDVSCIFMSTSHWDKDSNDVRSERIRTRMAQIIVPVEPMIRSDLMIRVIRVQAQNQNQNQALDGRIMR